MQIIDLSVDTRHTIPDHPLWEKLLKQSQQYGGEVLNRALYMIRSVGARLEKQENGKLKIIPMFEPEGHWRNQAEWEEWARPTLMRFAAEIKQCLETLEV